MSLNRTSTGRRQCTWARLGPVTSRSYLIRDFQLPLDAMETAQRLTWERQRLGLIASPSTEREAVRSSYIITQRTSVLI